MHGLEAGQAMGQQAKVVAIPLRKGAGINPPDRLLTKRSVLILVAHALGEGVILKPQE